MRYSALKAPKSTRQIVDVFRGYKPTDSLIDIADRPVGVGDTYTDGKFYRDGAEVLTELEVLKAELADAREALELLGVTADE